MTIRYGYGTCAIVAGEGSRMDVQVSVSELVKASGDDQAHRTTLPPHRLGVVLWDALAVVVHDAEIVLGFGIALRGGEAAGGGRQPVRGK